jgi:dTDP-4-amino-4,6-dideoxygalactose transaminase
MASYEARFAAMFGSGFYAFAFWKGRIALYAILLALDLRDDDEVLLPGYTCVVVPNAVRYAGAKPTYADIAPGGYNLDPVSAKQRITSRTRALIVQHTYGIPADLEALSELAHEHELTLIEDCAHVLVGSGNRGRLMGSSGLAAFFSFQWSKPYTTGLGGMVVTQDAKMAQRLREIQRSFVDPPYSRVLQLHLQYRLYQKLFQPRLYWRSRALLHLLSRVGLLVGSSSSAELYARRPADLRWRMSDFQKHEGLVHLSRVTDNRMHRHHLTNFYSDMLRRRGWTPVDADCVTLLRYPVLVADRATVLGKARSARIELGTWFETPLHPLRLRDHHCADYRIGSCPVAEGTAASVVNLPLHHRVTRTEAENIMRFLFAKAVQVKTPTVA